MMKDFIMVVVVVITKTIADHTIIVTNTGTQMTIASIMAGAAVIIMTALKNAKKRNIKRSKKIVAKQSLRALFRLSCAKNACFQSG